MPTRKKTLKSGLSAFLDEVVDENIVSVPDQTELMKTSSDAGIDMLKEKSEEFRKSADEREISLAAGDSIDKYLPRAKVTDVMDKIKKKFSILSM